MGKRITRIMLLLVVLLVLILGGLLALPSVVQAIPGRYRVALAQRSPFLSDMVEGVIEQVAPVATALPAPQPAVSATAVNIGQLIAAETADAATPITGITPEIESGTEQQATAVPTTVPTDTPVPPPTLTPTPTPPPERVALEGLSGIPQSFNNCGPANLTQVLRFYNLDLNQAQVASYLKPNVEDRNVSPWQIADYVNTQTPLHATVHSGGTLDTIKQFVAAGLPVVLEKGYQPNTAKAPGWWGHYLTVIGYDDASQQFYGLDTYLGPFNDARGRATSYGEVNRFWQQFNYTFYVVYQPGQEEMVHAILGPDMLDEETMWRQTASRAERETVADPDNAFAWFNLGTSLTHLGEMTGDNEFYQGGAQAFDQARTLGLPPRMLWYQFRVYTAYRKVGRYDEVIALADATLATQGGRNVEETYWHKGLSLEEQGNLAAAKVAYQDALRVNSNFYPAQISLDWVNSQLGS